MNRHDTLRRLLTDPRVSRNPNNWPVWTEGGIPNDWPLHQWVSTQSMAHVDGVDHKRLRGLVSQGFTPRRVTAMKPWIERITNDLLAALDSADPHDPSDIRERFAYPLPIEVICQLFGVPDQERPVLRDTVDGVFRTAATPQAARENEERMLASLGRLIAEKRRQPGDDMTSALIAARSEDQAQLTEPELMGTLVLLIAAGHETTVNLLDHAIVAMLTHPRQLDLVRSGEVSWTAVIEETLRWQSPVSNIPLRYVLEDIEIDGLVLHAGDAVLAGYAGAGRDPARFGPSADQFDVTRHQDPHVSFGHGPHYCLGAPLARLEAEVALPALFTRFPDLALAVDSRDLMPIPSFISNGHRELPVYLRGTPTR